MSESVGGSRSVSPAGRGSTGGGGDVVHPSHTAGAGCPSVTNQTLLALDGNLYDHLTIQQASALKLIQLEFARDVSSRTAAAYEQIIDALRTSAART